MVPDRRQWPRCPPPLHNEDVCVAAPFVLASNSPRRRALLREAGYEFEVVVPAVSELVPAHLSLRELTIANATRKAIAVARIYPGRIVLAADTLVAMDGEIIGKPCDLNHARMILRRLSGRTHDVSTAVCIIGAEGRISYAEISQVRFRKLTETAITEYFKVVNPVDKAGAYGAQGAGRSIIAAIKGSVTNVIGLPMARTKKALEQIGIRPLSGSRLQPRGTELEPVPVHVSIPGKETRQ
jgi:septum formation protein